MLKADGGKYLVITSIPSQMGIPSKARGINFYLIALVI